MSQLLDLSITLTPPPVGTPPETIASIALRCDVLGLSHSGDLLTDPLTQQERNNLRWYLEEYWKWPYEQFRERAMNIEESLTEIGRRLYQTVFGSFRAMGILQAWRLKLDGEHQISIVSEVPKALSLPWELLHDEQGFLALRTDDLVSIVRHLPQSEATTLSTSFEPPLRVLLVTARPGGAGFIDPRSIARELLDEVQSQVEAGAVELEFLRPPTLPALRKRLKSAERPVHILHFDGHGTFGDSTEVDGQDGRLLRSGEKGKLAFEDDKGQLDLVKAEVLAQVLQRSSVQLTVLTACQSAMSSEDDAFSSVAAQLIRSGVDAVVAMSTSLLVASATRYAEAFYRELAAGTSAPIAQERARQALHDDPRRHLQSRRRDEEGTPVELRDWWLPHFYQQRSLELRPIRPSGELKNQLVPSSARLSETMPAEPRYGFSGRAYELLQIERYLLRGKLVIINGFGGVGKTALAREAADWLTRTRMYDGACFVSFEHGGDATTLLSALGHFLGVYDGNYNPNDSKAALSRLKPVLKEKHSLVIADNLESILPGGEAPLETGVRTQLWDVLLELSKMGAGVLLTSRDVAFGDGRLSPGNRVAHLPLGGLHPEAAYALASRLLNDLQIDRARAPYGELRDLLVQLDHHPLAIQLVLPALRELPLSKIETDFVALLPKFEDDTETGRNRSLLASLDYSLRRLSEEQRALMPRLALFEGGANENELLAITEIPGNEWAVLRSALEQAALLTAERIHENVTVSFLRFHPVLAPYLRSLSSADDAALSERYARRYYMLASYLYDEEFRHPQPVRALVRRELPNLRRALELLIEEGELDTASKLASSITIFLGVFGSLRERDEMWRRVVGIVSVEDDQKSGVLTEAEYLRESDAGGDEFFRGDLRSAYTRFKSLLARIEALPQGRTLGRGSYEHCTTLHRLARCLNEGKQSAAAEARLREALAVVDALIGQQPEDQTYIRQRGMLLADLGDALRDQSKYQQAQKAYEKALEVAKQQSELRPQAVALTQLGTLELLQQNYTVARAHYKTALEIYHILGEPAMKAVAWHQLGMVAQHQEEWTEAERCYREALTLDEQRGDIADVAKTCNQLAIVASRSGRTVEAEGWYKRTLELDLRVHPGSPSHARHLSNLAALLLNQVQAGRAPIVRLADARDYAERSLPILETLDASSKIWKTLSILADIADLEGQTELAKDFRRRERETFAAFEGNRYHNDHQHGQLIAAIAAVAKGGKRAQEEFEAAIPQMEAKNKPLTDSIKRILAGERDWHTLAEDLDANNALLVLRILETIEQPNNAASTEAREKTPEQVIASLPATIREALEQGDQAAFEQALQALSPEDQQAVVEAIQLLQEQAGEEEKVDAEDEANVLQQFEPLLQAIAAIAGGLEDTSLRNKIDADLNTLETNGWHLRDAVQRIWTGERNAISLTAGLDEQDSALVHRVLEIIAEAGK